MPISKRALLRHSSLLALAIGISSLAACSSQSESSNDDADESEVSKSKNAAQMNDVSTLYPLAKTQSEFDNGYLKASATGRDGKALFLSETLYDKITGTLPPKKGAIGSDTQMQYANLRAVAYRLDPCFAQIGPITDPSTCKNQLRIIFQSANFAAGPKGGTSFIDGAVHAFYSLTREELTSALKEVIALRSANQKVTALGALAVHPILAEQGLEGAMAKGLNAILLKYAGEGNLTRFTKFQSANLQTTWHFDGFDLKAEVATPMVIPTLPTDTTEVSFFSGFAGDFSGSFTPPTTAKDNMQILGNLAAAQGATPAQQQAAYDAALRIENPNFHSPDTIDCASCHLAEPARALTGTKLGLTDVGNVNEFVADKKYVSKSSLAHTTPVTTFASQVNLHAFSYRNNSPMINSRVINESASVVAYVNSTGITKLK